MGRLYGGDGTIHQTSEVNVELDKNGKVVSVWYRCQLIAFTQNVVDDARAKDMRDFYERGDVPGVSLLVIED
jgi:hypothetical protein